MNVWRKVIKKYHGENITSPEFWRGVTTLGSYSFHDCALDRIVVPDGVESVHKGAFYGCPNLSICVLPDSVYKLEDGAFANCPNLRVVVLGNGIENIPNGAFANCPNLRMVILPDKLVGIGDNAFIGDGKLEYIAPKHIMGYTSSTTPSDLLKMGNKMPDQIGWCKRGEFIYMPSTLESIGARAFENCKGIKEFEYPTKVRRVSYGCFKNCHNLTTVALPTACKVIANTAFENCDQLCSINVRYIGLAEKFQYKYFRDMDGNVIQPNNMLPADCSVVGASAFKNCTSLTDMYISAAAICISQEAFYGATKLHTICGGGRVVNIGDNAFYGCSQLSHVSLGDYRLTCRDIRQFQGSPFYENNMDVIEPQSR